MGFLGLVVQTMTAVWLVYCGYFFQDNTSEFNLAIVLAAPILFMIGAAIKHNAKAAHSPRGFFAMIKFFIVSYVTGIILSAIFFGLGMGLFYTGLLRPEEGIGRYN